MIEKNVYKTYYNNKYMINVNHLTDGQCEGCSVSKSMYFFPYYIIYRSDRDGHYDIINKCCRCGKVTSAKWDMFRKEALLLQKLEVV